MFARFCASLRGIGDGLLTLAYPQSCRLCGAAVDGWGDGVVCAVCWETPAQTRLFLYRDCCRKCGIPLPATRRFAVSAGVPTASRAAEDDVGRACGRCHEQPFAVARACGAYAGALAANLLFLKTYPHLCRRLRQHLEQALAASREPLASEVVMPIPLHASRQAERGFNQAALIAARVAGYLRVPLDTTTLVRRSATARHRAGLDALDRARSVAEAFAASPARSASILLVDDLFTTGSTLAAATRALLQAGASRVAVFTLARVVAPTAET